MKVEEVENRPLTGYTGTRDPHSNQSWLPRLSTIRQWYRRRASQRRLLERSLSNRYRRRRLRRTNRFRAYGFRLHPQRRRSRAHLLATRLHNARRKRLSRSWARRTERRGCRSSELEGRGGHFLVLEDEGSVCWCLA